MGGAGIDAKRHFGQHAERSEGAFHAMLLVEVGLAEHLGHQVAFFDADAMFARQHAADLDAQAQYVGPESLGALELAFLHHVENDQGVEIAVAGMKDIAEAQAILFGQDSHLVQYLRQGMARDGAVHADHVGRKAPHGGKRSLAARPDAGALFFVGGFHRLAAALRHDSGHTRDGMGDVGLDAIGVDDQDSFGAGGIARLVIAFDRCGGASVHELHGGGHHAIGDDGGDAGTGGGHGVEGRHQGARDRRLAQDLHHHLNDDAQQAFRAGNYAQQIKPALRAALAAQGDDLAARQHQGDAQQIVGGQAIFQAVQPAGILRHIAADGAGNLAGGIGRVIEALGFHRLGDVQIGDAGLDHDAAIFIIDLEDALHAPHADQYAVFARQRAAGQRSAGAARHDGNAFGGCVFQDFADLLAVGRQDADQRHLVIGAERIGIESGKAGLIRDHAVRHDSLQRRDNIRAAGDDPRIGNRKKHARL